MGVHVMMGHVHHAPGNVGAVVTHPLQRGEQIRPDKAALDAARSLLHPQNVMHPELFLQVINNLFQGFHLVGFFQVVLPEGGERQRHNFVHRPGQHRQFMLSGVGEVQMLLLQLLSRLHQVQGMVTNALEIIQGLEEHGGFAAVSVADFQGAEFHQVGAQDILVVVGAVFLLPNLLGQRRIELPHQGHAVVDGLGSHVGHLKGQTLAALQGDGGGGEQTLVQFRHHFRLFVVRHQPAHQLLQQVPGGQQNGSADDIEHCVADGDAQVGGLFTQDGGGQQGLHSGEENQADHGAQNVEHQVNHSSPFGVLGGAHGGEHGGDAGADVLAHDDGDGGGVAHRAGGGQSLQNTHGGGGGLDDGGEHRAGQHAQNGVGEQQEQLLEGGHILQPGYGVGHGLHAEHQRGEAQEDHAGVLFPAVLQEHIVHDTPDRKDGRKGAGLEQLHQHIAALNTAQGQDPGSDSGAHIGAHDHVDGLAQGQKTRVYEAHHHHRSSGGGLDHSGYRQAREEAQHPVGGEFAQQRPQAGARPALQGLSHDVHAEQEQAQAAHHGQTVKNIHSNLPFFFFRQG